ncbi:molybdopterin cofactor-binding domain-containing protein [Deinococcus soli (ex Cha et al. 2016)]|uniref:Isoquinoline 1-oxidoreductase beta subunit n=2 Tax=Deinococcus soli (ex Cha et al. 2016) TaxID=1309411 RepID=A0AAE3XI05_9DEIO|nr:molybdopterin cofactor-binding domain-containing protein [Deinococcus soli (ex Cha et al. 2016)]MDR6220922.1 isoquinoline 1-oxidoreductase beta subunit [Deinococcus soli (ex Cha et al. 2016)]MDR6330894.1 isoquinoline 1-oxidoreductase beta subunit [Deinococcus soli (ex Cha et al. 2016)]MDR6754080.1 isoquinoline 1-oxidoreductase beta subunit [Deinococcus soli (ex Cha et al. 2016)]
MKPVTRRRVLIGLGSGAGLLVVGVPLALTAGRPALVEFIEENGTGPQDAPRDPDLWFEVTPAGVTFFVPKVEMGQGIHTALAQIAAEELEVTPEQLTVRQADTARGYAGGTMFTFGSTSVKALYRPLREAAATLRELLREEAARQLGVPAARLTAAGGSFFVAGSRERIPYAQVVAGKQGEWVIPEVAPTLKARRDFKRIGRAMPRTDFRDKVLGTATYGYDARLPGMLFGAVARPPRFGARLVSASADAAGRQPGVVRVVIDLKAGFAGVVARTRTQARAALPSLDLRWEGGTTASSADLDAQIQAGSGSVLRRRGNVRAALSGGTVVQAEYRTPLAAHAHLEPLAALADVQADGRIEVWASTQYPQMVIDDLRGVFGKDREVLVHPTQLGGGFGRKAGQHAALEAARLSAAVGKPVHVGWTREEDLQHAFYRPPTHHVLRGSVGADGRLRGVEQFTAGGDIIWGQTGLPEFVRDALGFDPGGLAGQFLPYDLPAYRVVNRREALPVPTGYWRGLGVLPNTFALESFMDELAHAARVDPLAFRLRHLGSSGDGGRLRTVLDRAARAAGWGTPVAAGRARGVACCLDLNTASALVAEVSVDGGQVRVHRVTVAVDPGLVVNPDGARLQIQGSVMMALSSALHEELTIQDGRVVESNFDRYRLLPLRDAPEVEVLLIESGEDPQGLGEPVMGPAAAAVANAVFTLTGQRLRTLPLRPGS